MKQETNKGARSMKIETEYDKYGWKLLIRKSKDGIVTISQRNKDRIHMIHKPMELMDTL